MKGTLSYHTTKVFPVGTIKPFPVRFSALVVYYPLLMNTAEVRPGVIFPTREIGTDPIVIRDFVQSVEQMGFGFLVTYDHILGTEEPTGNNHYSYRDLFHEPFTLYSYLAGVTRSIQFIPGVIVLPQRETALVAKQAAEVDILSGGRLVLGIGVGSNPEEFGLLGHEYRTRGKRIEQQVSYLRELWTKDLIDHDENGKPTQRYGINPRPNRSIPIWMGGWADAVLERTARIGDGWMPMGNPQDVAPKIDHFRMLLRANGKNPDTFPIMGSFGRRFSVDGSQTREVHNPSDMEAWVTMLGEWQDIGVTYLAFRTNNFGFRTADEHLNQLETWKNEFDRRTTKPIVFPTGSHALPLPHFVREPQD